ncbi:MAG: hypothetical protein IPO91_25335 [Chloroflexi bacterium]|nr:hypothetical protein [Chloroflexota bacterium]
MTLKPTTGNADLRQLAVETWGRPLASSSLAALWRCPCCQRNTHSIMMVAADQFRCLGQCRIAGGLLELETLITASAEHVPDDVLVEIGA